MTEMLTELAAMEFPRQKRKILLRSTGSFSILEEKIVAPTPRKFPNLPCSPKSSRKETSASEKDSGIFGEAGFEIQSILLSSFEGTGSSVQSIPETLENVACLEVEEEGSTKSARVVSPLNPIILASPPLRSSNPITLNSPFHQHDEKLSYQSIVPSNEQSSTRKTRGSTFHATKQLHRTRSASWPFVAKKPLTPVVKT